MTDWIRQHRRFVTVFTCTFLCTVVLGLLYLLFAHPLIASMYHRESIDFLNNVITQQDTRPLEYYYDKADYIFYRQVLFFPLGMLLFYSLVYFSITYLLGTLHGRRIADTAERGQYFRYDTSAAFILYGLFTLLMFYPYLGTIATHLIGPPGDNVKYLWNMWWGYRSLGEASAGFAYTDLVFYPEGASLYYNDYSWYHLGLSFFLRQFLPPAAVYNVLILHGYILAGLAMFLLVRYLTRSSWAGIVGGFIFAFNPSHVAHSMQHINIGAIQFVPLFVLFFIRAVRSKGRRSLVLAALFFLLNALCNWNYVVFNSYFMILSYAYLAFRRRQLVLPDVLKRCAIIVAATTLVLSPWVIPMLLLGFTHPETAGGGHNMFVADALGYVIPCTYHLLGGVGFLQNINHSYSGNIWEWSVYLGIVNIGLVVYAMRKKIRGVALYLCGGLAFLILSMGTYIHLLGEKIPVLLPYSPLKWIPIIASTRAPSRNIVYVYLFLAIIVGFAVKYLYDSWRQGKIRGFVVAGILALVVVDYGAVLTESTEVSMPACYREISGKDVDYAILDLPGGRDKNKRYMMYQIFHGLPMVQGTIPRKIKKTLIDVLVLDDLTNQKKQLIDNKVKYIVIHKHLIEKKDRIDIENYRISYEVVYEDGQNVVCRVY